MDILRLFFCRVFNIRPEDWKPLLLLQALIVSICAVIASSKTVANSLFVAHAGVGALPYVYMASAACLGFSGFMLIPLIDKLPRLSIYRWTAVSLAGCLGLSFLAILARQTWIFYVVYLLASLADSILFLEFWLIAQDLCDARQAKRIFPLVIGWSLVGGILGAFGTKFLVAYIHTEFLLLASAVLLLGTLALIQMIQTAFPRETSLAPVPRITCTIGKWPRIKLDLQIVRQSPLVKLICVSFVLYAVLAFLTDFLFNAAAVRQFTVNGAVAQDRLTAFFGLFDGISICVALVIQFFLASRLLAVMGITNAQLLLPGMLGLGFMSIFLGRFFGGVRGAFVPTLATRLGQKCLSSSIHRSSMSVLYSPIASEKRGRARTFAESIVQPAGVFLAGLLILSVERLPLSLVAALATAISIAYFWLTVHLRKVYLRQILKMFEEKNFGALESFAGMFARLGEKEILEKLCDCLADKDFNIRNFVVELLGQIKNKSAVGPLCDLYHSEQNNDVRGTVVQVLGRLGTSRATAVLREALSAPDPRIRANAIEAVAASKNSDLYDLIPQALTDPSPRVSTNAAVAVWNLKLQNETGRAMEILLEGYRRGPMEQKLSCLYAFGEIGTPECVDILVETARQADKKILARAIASLGSTRSQKAAQTLIDLLPRVNTSMQNSITAALIKLARHCPQTILDALRQPEIYAKRSLIAVAATLDDARLGEVLRDVALAEIEAIHRHRDWQYKVRQIPQKDVQDLLYDTFDHLNKQARENVLAIIRTLAGNTPAIQRIIKDLSHPNRFVRASALDALEVVGHKAIAKALVPILEERMPAAGAAEPAKAANEEILGWIRQWLNSPYRWIRACGVFGAGRLGLQAVHEELISSLSDSYELVRANAVEALARLGLDSNRVYIQRMLSDSSPLPRRYAEDLLR